MSQNVYTAPTSSLETDIVYCRTCGNKLSRSATKCDGCGAEQLIEGKSKIVAGLLAIFLGAFGFHRFYLGQWWGLVYLLLFWTGIPGIIAFIEGIVFFFTSKETWNKKHGNAKGASAVALVAGAFILVFIIGILAAIAVPAYQQYTIRAQQSALGSPN